MEDHLVIYINGLLLPKGAFLIKNLETYFIFAVDFLHQLVEVNDFPFVKSFDKATELYDIRAEALLHLSFSLLRY